MIDFIEEHWEVLVPAILAVLALLAVLVKKTGTKLDDKAVAGARKGLAALTKEKAVKALRWLVGLIRKIRKIRK
jgi:hypothetical protein